MTNEPIPSLAEALTVIRRQRDRIAALEAEIAALTGSLAKPAEPDEPPSHVEHNLPPSAPPHDE